MLEARLCWKYLKVKPIRKVMGQAIFEPLRFKSGNFNNGIACLPWDTVLAISQIGWSNFPVLSLVWSCYHISQHRLRWCDHSDSVIETELDNHPRAIAIIGLWLLDYWLADGAVLERVENVRPVCADLGKCVCVCGGGICFYGFYRS